MKVSEMFPSKYMKAEDFAEGEVRVLTIKNYEMTELGQGDKKETKPVVSFREPDTKQLALNKTNAAVIAKQYGEDADDWIGKKIALHVMEVESFGDVVQAIRVKSKLPTAPMSDDLFEDEAEDEQPAPLHWSETNEGTTLLRNARTLGYKSQREIMEALKVTDWKQFDGTAMDALKVLADTKQVPQPA